MRSGITRRAVPGWAIGAARQPSLPALGWWCGAWRRSSVLRQRPTRRDPQRGAAREPRQPAPERPGTAQAQAVALQQAAGNAATVRVLGRQAAAPTPQPLTNDPLTGTTVGDLTPPAGRPTLRRGSTAPEVAVLQQRLNEDGADPPLAVDGIFGRLTAAAVRAFQRRHGLQVDGIVGPQTWGLLDELARAGIFGAHDVLAGTHAVSAEEAAAISGHLATTPPAPGQMTGAGPGGPYEQSMFLALDAHYAAGLARLGPPSTTMAHAAEIGRVAQRLVDDFYSDHIVMASRPPALDEYHPGSYRLPLADASTRQVDPTFARLWVEMDMEFSRDEEAAGVQPADVSEQHEVDTRRPVDQAEVRRVADKYLQSGRLPTVVQYIRAYPAEASEATAGSGPIYLQLGDPSFAGREGMWDLLSGMMHEYLHIAAHPHYQATAEQLGGRARRVLIEGMCDYFREQAWNALFPRLVADLDLRSRVEGPYFTALPDTAAIEPHGTYPEIEDARAIVAALDRVPAGGGPIQLGSAGGEANARAAYFLGHVDLLGIGPATAGSQPAGALGTWQPTDETEADVYVVGPGGETVGEVMDRTNSTGVFEEDGTGWVDRTHPFLAGHRLRVRGIRYVRAVQHDTRAQVANQNGVGQEQLERANRWSPAPGDTPIAPGTRVLIPAH